VNDGGRSATLPFSRIREVRLFCETTGQTGLFSHGDFFTVFFCELRMADRQSIMLSSNMAGRYLYRDFVRILHQRLVPGRRRIKFRGGWNWRRFIGWCLWEGCQSEFSFGSFFVPLFPLFSEDRLAFRQNRPRRYRPDRLPDFLLPDVGTISPP
jgi:hypothetical protein